MGARKGNRHPGCQGSAPALEVSCGQIPWRDAEAASLPGHSEWLPAPLAVAGGHPTSTVGSMPLLHLCHVGYVAALHLCLVRPIL